ncbi:MAG: HAD hydrolase family protein [Megasphaera sp.]|jgi:3-deoxy-D-manno-octulosonate 8-phosphate phosphatase (KDO 8-P phosphatase)|nr:HAD hydrolase family protein [Megasphaera sp.]MCH4187050.1 HAD hydrolase family protein [Megasphaera sp.]MCH4217014.1 HAD hydrolase family protein [Megasphaera sp.]
MKFLTDIKLLALDVDGVLTDGIIYYSPAGDAMKGFSARDGMGISLVRAAGLKTALITGRRSPMVEQRAKDLHIDYVIQDAERKLPAMEELCNTIGLTMAEVAYMGDDLNDVELISHCGFGAAPLDACEEARRAAAFVSAYNGGHGALREFVEYILKNQDLWNVVLDQYLKGTSVLPQ